MSEKLSLEGFYEIAKRKASPEALERIRNGIKGVVDDAFFETSSGTRVKVYYDPAGHDTVFEEDIKRIDPEKAEASWELQLHNYGMEKYKNTSFETICTYNFFSHNQKFPRDIMKIFKERPICLFYGGPGTGKTTLACAIGREYTKDGNSVVIRRWSNWLQQLRETFNNTSNNIISHHMKKAQDAKMLILDEIGNDRKKVATEFEVEQLSRVISDRYGNGLPLVLTTNLNIKQLEGVYGYQISSRLQDVEKSFLQWFDGEIDRRKNPGKGKLENF